MAPAPSASAFPLHPNSCLLDEHDRMLFQHSHPTGTDAERTTLQEGVEGFSAAISKAIQPQSHALHLDQRAGTLPTHHRSNERVPGSSSQATKAAEDQPKYYKELTVRCSSSRRGGGNGGIAQRFPRWGRNPQGFAPTVISTAFSASSFIFFRSPQAVTAQRVCAWPAAYAGRLRYR